MVENFFKEGKLLVIPKKNAKKVQVFQRVPTNLNLGKNIRKKKSISDLEKSMKIMHF